ncbi:MAG: hypothetical protein QOG87_2283 [Actinomycetota bacterium]
MTAPVKARPFIDADLPLANQITSLLAEREAAGVFIEAAQAAIHAGDRSASVRLGALEEHLEQLHTRLGGLTRTP